MPGGLLCGQPDRSGDGVGRQSDSVQRQTGRLWLHAAAFSDVYDSPLAHETTTTRCGAERVSLTLRFQPFAM